ncbi:MAG TPA: glycine oxidase ThiO [Candidatus Acidoferrales bacterium]|nr:glycine oxidase ThiO [Candidatus Acidoferrales bacterium]
MNACDVVVVGGGIIGSSIAFELAAENLRVRLIDRQAPGQEATWAAAGMLSPGPHTPADEPLVPFARESLLLYPEFIAAIEEVSRMKVEFLRNGAIETFAGPQAEEKRDELLKVHERFDLAAEAISIEEARRMEPGLGPAAQAAAWLAKEASVDPRSLMGALITGAKNRGVETVSQCPVKSLILDGRRCMGVSTESGRVDAKTVILAAGCYTGQIVDGSGRLREAIPTRPVRGQMVALRAEGTNLKRVIRAEKGYLVPRRDGRILAGSTLEDVGFEKRVTPEGLEEILDAAREIVPALVSAKILENWAGLRPGTPDALPILGATEIEGLFVATGHYRNGILLAPATAKTMTKAILSGEVDDTMARFSPNRFAQENARGGSGAIASAKP